MLNETAEPSLPSQLIEHARALAESGLNRGTAGNVSVRAPLNAASGIAPAETASDPGPGFLITPTGMAYDGLTSMDIPWIGLDGRSHGPRKPSSEWRLHHDIYLAKPEVGAIVHAHSPFATSLACLRHEIPPFHYMIARFGGDTVRCADYALFGTQALSDATVKAMEGRSACLLANHGMVVAGKDLPAALAAAIELETLCEQYWRALQVGEPVLLSAEQMAEVFVQFAGYGKQG
jgi:L-fuculose-phosphate aldolase